jgi:hypothetical protein
LCAARARASLRGEVRHFECSLIFFGMRLALVNARFIALLQILVTAAHLCASILPHAVVALILCVEIYLPLLHYLCASSLPDTLVALTLCI